MFTGTKYITQGIKTNISTFVQYILWHMIETMNIGQKDYLQVFQLEGVFLEGKLQQKIIHSQEEPNYRKEYTLFTKKMYTIKYSLLKMKRTVRCCLPKNTNSRL